MSDEENHTDSSESDENKQQQKENNRTGEDMESVTPREDVAEERQSNSPQEDVSADQNDQGDQKQEKKEEEDLEGVEYYRDLVDKAKSVAELTDWSYVAMELDNISHRWDEGPGYTDTVIEDEVRELYKEYQQVREDFEQRRKEHYEKLENKKQKNLERKKELLEELRDIVENEKWQAHSEVDKIRGQWQNITLLPKNSEEELDEKYNELLSVFEDNKVDYLVQKAQKEEENLQGKLLVLDKMEMLAESIDKENMDWKGLHRRFEDLNKQWKKIGRVPRDKKRKVWERYKEAKDKYYEQKYKYDEIFRKKYDKHLSKKEKLIEEAEGLMDMEDLAKASSKVNKLHRRWKKAGNLPQKKENELWKRFKSATDAFNKKKSENIGLVRQQEEEHYQEKLKLIEKAEEVKETDDFKKGHDKMQSLMQKWKDIGPAPHEKSEKIWQQFKGAMDYFYDRRREFFKERDKRQKENLKKCNEIIGELQDLGDHEDPIEAVNEAKPLQEKFKNIGYVPIKQKNKVWKKYRKALDVIYDRYRAAKKGEKKGPRVSTDDVDPQQRKKIRKKQKQFGKIKKQVGKLKEEVLQYKESRTYFKASSDEGNALQQQIEEKIENAEQELKEKEEKLDELSQQIEELKNKGKKEEEESSDEESSDEEASEEEADEEENGEDDEKD